MKKQFGILRRGNNQLAKGDDVVAKLLISSIAVPLPAEASDVSHRVIENLLDTITAQLDVPEKREQATFALDLFNQAFQQAITPPNFGG